MWDVVDDFGADEDLRLREEKWNIEQANQGTEEELNWEEDRVKVRWRRTPCLPGRWGSQLLKSAETALECHIL